MVQEPLTSMRLDKWLWCARFYKTRALAVAGINGGKVDLNGERAKPAKVVRVGDRLAVRHGALEWEITVRACAPRRGSPALAAALYEEDQAARARREDRQARMRAATTAFSHGEGKPSKKERRILQRFRDKHG